MSDIVYRKLKKSDYNDIMELIDDAWHFDNFIQNKDCKYYSIKTFMLGTMFYQSYNLVAEMDGKVVGVLFGKIPKLKNFFKNVGYLPQLLYAAQKAYFSANKYNKKMIKSFINMLKIYKELLKKLSQKYDGELEFFLVHSKAQGKGIGKTLWQTFKNCCKENNMKKIYLYTDEHCNFGFYDHNGFVRKQKTPAVFDTYKGKDKFNIFLYANELD